MKDFLSYRNEAWGMRHDACELHCVAWCELVWDDVEVEMNEFQVCAYQINLLKKQVTSPYEIKKHSFFLLNAKWK